MTKNIFLLLAGIIATVAGLVQVIIMALDIIDIIPYIQYFFQDISGIFTLVIIALTTICLIGVLISGIIIIASSMKGQTNGVVANIVFIALILALVVLNIVLNGFAGFTWSKYLFPVIFAGVLVLDIIGLSVSKKAA